MAEQEKERGFTVTDRRGIPREPESPPQPQAERSQPADETRQQAQAEQDASFQLPDADFMTLIFSLYTHAQINLGLVPDPMSGLTAKDMVQAKYNIDILAILQEKTQGNLDQEEEQALEQMLYELRMNFVQAG